MDMNDIKKWAQRAGGQPDEGMGSPDAGDEMEGEGSDPMDLTEAMGQLKGVLDGLKAHGPDSPDLSKVTDELSDAIDMLQEAMDSEDEGSADDEESPDEEEPADDGDSDTDDDGSSGNPFGS